MKAIQQGLGDVAIEIVKSPNSTNVSWDDADSNGDTALHYAARHSSPQTVNVVEMLMQQGADLMITNNKGRLPIHIACNANR